MKQCFSHLHQYYLSNILHANFTFGSSVIRLWEEQMTLSIPGVSTGIIPSIFAKSSPVT